MFSFFNVKSKQQSQTTPVISPPWQNTHFLAKSTATPATHVLSNWGASTSLCQPWNIFWGKPSSIASKIWCHNIAVANRSGTLFRDTFHIERISQPFIHVLLPTRSPHKDKNQPAQKANPLPCIGRTSKRLFAFPFLFGDQKCVFPLKKNRRSS